MNLKDKVNQSIQSLISFKNKKNVLIVAVSGGVDSVVAATILHQLNYSVHIAHCNFKLRGNESDRDEQFVKQLAQELKVPIHTIEFNTQEYATNNKISIQVAARDLRYNWFKLLQQKIELDNSNCKAFTITAHHCNDNVETTLFNFCRGTGIQGISGIKPLDTQRNIIRPLLQFYKKDIEKYAFDNKINFVQDSSNALTKYTRNYFRQNILPSIKEVIMEVEDNIAANIERFKDVEIIYNQFIETQKSKLLVQNKEDVQISILKLLQVVPLNTIVWEIIKGYGFTSNQVSEVIKLCTAHNAALISNDQTTIFKNRAWLIIAKNKIVENNIVVVDNIQKQTQFTHGVIKFIEKEKKGNSIEILNNENVANLDSKNIQFPLVLRPAKTGDYFYPLGMNKKKKLNRFFIDLKLSPIQKKQVWVLEMDKKIIWVIGLRIDDRFKVQHNTTSIVEISFLPNY